MDAGNSEEDDKNDIEFLISSRLCNFVWNAKKQDCIALHCIA